MPFVKLAVDADKNKPVKLHFSIPPKTTNSQSKLHSHNDDALSFMTKIVEKMGPWEGAVYQQNSNQMKDKNYLGEINFSSNKGDVASHIRLAKEIVKELKKEKMITPQDAEKATDDLERFRLTHEGKPGHQYL